MQAAGLHGALRPFNFLLERMLFPQAPSALATSHPCQQAPSWLQLSQPLPSSLQHGLVAGSQVPGHLVDLSCRSSRQVCTEAVRSGFLWMLRCLMRLGSSRSCLHSRREASRPFSRSWFCFCVSLLWGFASAQTLLGNYPLAHPGSTPSPCAISGNGRPTSCPSEAGGAFETTLLAHSEGTKSGFPKESWRQTPRACLCPLLQAPFPFSTWPNSPLHLLRATSPDLVLIVP